ncbi:RSNARE, VAMP71-family [Acanthamoeba castellanii str. Neff]|uniref:RSNARE, VAMP71-family n=1 Tax=Acanthamoeba castellanii (strain ATCC 30010 / Neff) TaxID=1257118 RepID=L8H6Z7_ACACF|nr:RSNARE, VAMP71-family [Acanthamoeba castellanii str. Neff]ELR21002.1 RSNARE, VAMP71-family [Acanthamoeba castellanii str. Neff]
MPIIYSLVARGSTVLAEHAAATGNFITVSRLILDKIADTSGGKMSYTYDRHYFHYAASEGVIYLNTYKTAMAFGMNEEFSRVLQRQMEYFSYDPSVDKISLVQKKVDETKKVMVENIERVLDRGEKIELLVTRTEQLQDQSYRFSTESRRLKWSMCRDNYKLWAILVIVVIIIVWLISSFICGFDYSKCS